MLVEQRTYTVHPGKAGEFARFFEQHDLAFMRPIMGDPVGWYTTEIGPLNQVIQMWAFDSYEQRLERRQAVAERPEWNAHLAHMAPLVAAQESKLLVPAPFFAEMLKAGLKC